MRLKLGVMRFRDESGAIFIETLLVIPVVTILAIGIMEFGNILWQRHQVETGVRDAARYWARCRPTFSSCSITTAKNIAFYGTPAPGARQALRVPGWYMPNTISISPAVPPTAAEMDDVVRVTGVADYQGSVFARALSIGAIRLTYTHEQRYLGW